MSEVRVAAAVGQIEPALTRADEPAGPRPRKALSRRNIIVYGVLMLAFLPMYEIAFLHGRAWAAAAAVVALLALARLWRRSPAIDASVMPRSAVRR